MLSGGLANKFPSILAVEIGLINRTDSLGNIAYCCSISSSSGVNAHAKEQKHSANIFKFSILQVVVNFQAPLPRTSLFPYKELT